MVITEKNKKDRNGDLYISIEIDQESCIPCSEYDRIISIFFKKMKGSGKLFYQLLVNEDGWPKDYYFEEKEAAIKFANEKLKLLVKQSDIN